MGAPGISGRAQVREAWPSLERGGESARQALEKSTWNELGFQTYKQHEGSAPVLLPEGASRAEPTGWGVPVGRGSPRGALSSREHSLQAVVSSGSHRSPGTVSAPPERPPRVHDMRRVY